MSYHPMKATDYGHTILLFFTQLLKNIGHRSSQIGRGGLGERGRDPFRSTCFLTFFFLHGFFFRDAIQAREKGRDPGRFTYINFQQVDG
jgi:hypothetical protein